MGDIHAWPETCAWSPLVRLSAILKPNKQMSTDAKHMVEKPRGTPSMQTDLFERWDRIPMCSFLWGTAMHGRTPVQLSPLSKSNEQAATHTKQMINNAKGMPLPVKMHVKGGPDFPYLWLLMGDSQAWTDKNA